MADFATNYMNALVQGGRDTQAAQHRNALLEMQERGQAFNQGIAQQRLGMEQERHQMAKDALTRELAMIEEQRGKAAAIAEAENDKRLGLMFRQAEEAGDIQALNGIWAEMTAGETGPQMPLTAETLPQISGFVRAGVDTLEGYLAGAPKPYKAQSARGKEAQDIASGLQLPPEKPADEYGRYVAEEQAAGRQPLSRIEFKRAGQKTTRIEAGPDGGVRIVEGFGGEGLPKTTEGEKSAAGYLSRMRAAEETLSSLGDDATRSLTSLLVGGTNFEGLILGPEQEKILQAQRDWVRAKLRKESGAVIGEEEMAEEIRTYFPLPGEDASTVEQKRKSRMEAERQFEIISGNAAPQAERRAESSGSPLGIPQLLDLYGE